MVAPTTNSVPTSSRAFQACDNALRQIKRETATVISALAADSLATTTLTRGYVPNLMRFRDQLQENKDTASISDFARSELKDETLDYVAEVEAVIAAIQGVLQNLDQNYPQATVALAGEQRRVVYEHEFKNGSVQEIMLTQADLSGLGTALNTLDAAIAE